MTILAVVCAGLALWWVLPRPRDLPGPAPVKVRSTPRAVRVPLFATLALVLLWTVTGPMVAVPATAVGIIALTIARVAVLRIRARKARRVATEVAQACTVLAAELSLGRVPTVALDTAAEDCPILAPAAGAARIGGDVPQTWQRQAAEPGCHGLGVLSRAWQVALITGAALAPSLAAVAEALSAAEEVDQLVAGELAAPKMTGLVLSLLPVAGVGLGFAIGGDPLGFLLGSPWGWACLLTGVTLTGAGLLWTEHLASPT